MFRILSEPAKAALFYVVAVGLAIVIALLAARPGSDGLIMLYMFSPLAAVAILHFGVTRDGRTRTGWRKLALGRPGLRAWPFAFLVAPVLLGAVTLAVWATGIGAFRMPEDAGPWALWPLALIAHIGLGMIFAFGEEVGWRGYLLPSLAGLGLWPAMILTGFLHGLWHLPVMLLTPFYHHDGLRWIVIPEFLAVLTLAGVVYGYLRYISGSIWPAVLLHATFNEFLQQYASITTAPSPAMLEYFGAESGVFTILGAGTVVAWIAWRWRPTAQGTLVLPVRVAA